MPTQPHQQGRNHAGLIQNSCGPSCLISAELTYPHNIQRQEFVDDGQATDMINLTLNPDSIWEREIFWGCRYLQQGESVHPDTDMHMRAYLLEDAMQHPLPYSPDRILTLADRNTLRDEYCLPASLAWYARRLGFAHASVILAGNIIPWALTKQYPDATTHAAALGIPITRWRYLPYTSLTWNNHLYLVAVIVTTTAVWGDLRRGVARVMGIQERTVTISLILLLAALCFGGGYAISLSIYSLLGFVPTAQIINSIIPLLHVAFARTSLHWLFLDQANRTVMDPATGGCTTSYWYEYTAPPNCVYWNTGVYGQLQ